MCGFYSQTNARQVNYTATTSNNYDTAWATSTSD
jgi:hypothetical protein